MQCFINKEVGAFETNVWEAKHWREAEIVAIELTDGCCAQVRIQNAGMKRCPKFVRLAGRLKLTSPRIEERSHLALNFLSGSSLRIEQVELWLSRSGLPILPVALSV